MDSYLYIYVLEILRVSGLSTVKDFSVTVYRQKRDICWRVDVLPRLGEQEIHTESWLRNVMKGDRLVRPGGRKERIHVRKSRGVLCRRIDVQKLVAIYTLGRKEKHM
jgi:hypothetical protein